MPFAEPRPNRRPFCVHDDLSIIVTPKAGNLALTSLTLSNQNNDSRFVYVSSVQGASTEYLMMVLVPGVTTVHLPFPHPIMVGTRRSLRVDAAGENLGLFPITAVGYEWVAADERGATLTKGPLAKARPERSST